MALTVGELVATLNVDASGMVRGLSAAELAMAGLQRSANGRLRDVRGRFVSAARAAELVGAASAEAARVSQAAADEVAAGAEQARAEAAEALRELQADAERTATRVHGTLEEALSTLPDVQVTADTSEADRELSALRQRLEVLREVHLDVALDDEQANRDVAEVRAQLVALAESHPDVEVRARIADAVMGLDLVYDRAAAVDGADPTVQVHADTAGAERHLAEVAAVAEAVDHLDPTIDVHADRSKVAGLGRLLTGLGGAVGAVTGSVGGLTASLGPLLATMGTAVPLAAGLATTLAQVAPAAGIAATGVLMAVSASAALKIGMSGVSVAVKDAFNPNTKPDALKKALDGLAPPARAFVLQLRAMKPEFDHLKLGVQSALFAGLAGTVHGLGESLLPVLRSQLTQTAGTLNIMAKSVADTASSLADSGVLGRALKGANAGLRNLQSIPAQIVNALGLVAAAAAPTFNRLTAAAGGAAQRLSDRMNAAFDSGGMTGAINTAVSVIKQLGGVLKNVGSIVGSVFKAAQTAGGSWLGVLGQITGAMAKAFAGPGVQAALGALFSTMRVLGQTVGPLVTKALAALGPVLVALAPPVQRLIKALGAALGPVIVALGPVLAATAFAVGQLSDALLPLLGVVGKMIASLGPVLAPVLVLVGQLIGDLAPVVARLGAVLLPPFAKLMSTLGAAFTKLAPVLDTAVQQLGQGLLPVVDGLGTVVAQFVDQYADQFTSMFEQLLPVIPVLIPVVVQLAESIGQVLTALAPLLPQIMLLSAQFLTQLLPAILPLIPVWAKMENLLLRLATGAIVGVAIPALSGLIKFMRGMQKSMQPGIAAVKWVTTQIAHLFEWLSDHLVGHSVIPDMVKAIVVWLGRLSIQGVAAVAALPVRLAGVAATAASRMISALSRGVSSSARAVGRLPGMAKSALGNLGSYLYRSGQSLIRGFADGIASMASAVKNAAGNVLSKASDLFPHSPAKEGPFSGRGYPLYSGHAIGDALAEGMRARQSAVASAASALMGAASGRLAGSGSIGAGGYGGGYAAGAAAMTGGSAGGGVLRIEFAGPEEMKRLLRGIVRVDGGGSVQAAFGRG